MATFPFTWLALNDSATGELNVGISNVDTSLVLKTGQGAKFPSADFIVRVDDEDIYVATRSVDSCNTLTRGYGGTTAVAHIANTAVFQSAGKSLFQRIYDNVIGHTHPKADISDFAHSHPQADVTNLVTDLAAKEPANANIQAHVVSAHAPSNAQANADITKAEIEAKLTGVIASHSHSGGGSDPWTYVVLASDFITSSATAVNVTGLSFTPAANTRYEFAASLRTRTATTTVGPRPGLAWPTGSTDGVAFIRQSSGAGTIVIANGNPSAALLAPVGGVPTTTASHPAWIEGDVSMGASPSGTVQVQLATETAATNVTIKAGSFLKYRSY